MNPATTVMRDSLVGDAWIQEACRANPVQRVLDEKTGQPNGNILTGPGRLVFCDHLMKAGPKMKSDPNSKTGFQTGFLFTPYSIMDIFWEDYYKIAATDFAKHWNGQSYSGIDNPFYDQGTKAHQYNGFTPGCFATNMTSNYPPHIVDLRGNAITDERKVYPGVWAIIATNCYASGKTQVRKGPRFGLQSVIIIGDDKPLGGGAPDPRTLFKGVNVKPPVAIPSAQFGQAVQSGPQGGPGATQAYYPGSQAPGGGMPGQPPAMPPMGGYPGGPGHALPPPPAGAPPSDDDMSQFMN